MKKNTRVITLIVSVLMLVFVIDLMNTSCKRKKEEEEPSYPEPVTWSPDPVNGHVPEQVLPQSLATEIAEHFTVYSGVTPAKVHGDFLSHPHILKYSTLNEDTIGTVNNDRYISFERNGEDRIDFYGKQWDDEHDSFYEEVYRKINVVGTGENFSCYYITEGYPNGLYAKQSTIFSGKWTDLLGGIGDFEVAVILLETSNNPNLASPGTYRVLGDGDGLAENYPWLHVKSSVKEDVTHSSEDAFRMFRVK